MIKKIQQDFSYYSHEFKDNYRKGVHRLRTILASRAQAQAFVSNAGGTAVVLGYEPSAPDKNAQELYALLAASPYINDAVQTFLGSIYEAGAESQDAMYSDSARCLEILHDPVMARAAGAGAVSAGKWIATLAGQSCNLYRDMNAVAASDIAMTAVAASETAMEAVISGNIALNAVAASKTAMTAVAANETAMAAVAASRVAMSAIIGNSTALNAVVTSSVAMAAVIGNSTALNAVVSSSTAMAAVIGNSAALNAVVSSSTAMTAVAASSTAMAAVAASSTALSAIAASTTALNAIYAKKKRMSGASASLSGKFIILQISNDNAFDTSKYGYATLSDGSKPKWDSYKDKYAYFKQYKKIATYMKNDTDSDDWIDYFQC
nr:MAG TPA: Tail fiber protein [Caudoviricetes sp.]